MALSNFFRINFPYGIAKNSKNEWAAFNREHLPLGYTISILGNQPPGEGYLKLPIYSKYKNISEEELKEISNDDFAPHKDDNGKIIKVFLYNDKTIPSKNPENDADWNDYFRKLKIMAKWEVL